MVEYATTTDPDRHSARSPLEAGLVVSDRYELVRLLGRGAAGVVWLATHQMLASDVAVKFLDAGAADVDDPSFLVERFRFEAQVSARLAKRTDRIVAVHDGGLFEGSPFIVMDLVEGASVEAIIEQGGMPIAQVITMAHHVAEALDACHAESIAHRDVKPANILALEGPAGLEFKLADFGVAKLFGVAPKGVVSPRATAEQSLVGSPAYMSPETLSGDRTTSGAADLWALAATLYEAMTGQLPFDGDSGWPSIAVAIVSRKYAPVSTFFGSQAADADRFFERAFAVGPENRFASASELAQAFEAAALPLASTPRLGEPPSAPEARAPRAETPAMIDEAYATPRRRSLVIPIMIGIALLALVGGVALVLRGPATSAASSSAMAPPPSGHVSAPDTRPLDTTTARPEGSALTLANAPRPDDPRISVSRAAPPATTAVSAAPVATVAPPATAAPSVTATQKRPTTRPIDPSEIQ